MNRNEKTIKTEFGPETGFELSPTLVPFRAVQETRFEGLQAGLLREWLAKVWEPTLSSQLRRASNEAAALAWVTPYPLLVFPNLFQEKAEAALLFAERQDEIRKRSRELLAI